MSDQKVAIIIPAYNEEKTIGVIAQNLSKQNLVIVVDDGSTDRTASVAKNSGAHVIKHIKNKGYDSALETGIRKALILNTKFVVTFDADGQHNPYLIDQYIDKLEAGFDMVVGRRKKLQRWSEKVFSIIGYEIWGYKDLLCGMKGYKVSSLKNIKKIKTYQSVGTELFIRLSAVQSKIAEIDVNTGIRNGKSKFGNGIISNIKILYSLIVGIVLSLKLNIKYKLYKKST